MQKSKKEKLKNKYLLIMFFRNFKILGTSKTLTKLIFGSTALGLYNYYLNHNNNESVLI